MLEGILRWTTASYMTVTSSKLTNKHRPAKTYKYSYFTTTSEVWIFLPQDLATINNKQKFWNIQKIKKESLVIINQSIVFISKQNVNKVNKLI